MKSAQVGLALADDQMLDYSWYLEQLIEMKLPYLIYAGEYDSRDGPKT